MYNKQGLPSNGVYGYDSVYIRPLHVGDLTLAYRADVEDNITHIIDLVDSTIKDFDARDLTVPDFVYLMAWLRLNSYPVTPFSVSWECPNGHDNVSTLSETNLNIVTCTYDAETNPFKDTCLHAPTVRDMEAIQIIIRDNDLGEGASDADKSNIPTDLKEKLWLMRTAQYVSPIHGTIEERCEKLMHNDIPNIMESLGLLDGFKVRMQHGLTETANLFCSEEECDHHAGIEVTIPLKLVRFFPLDF